MSVVVAFAVLTACAPGTPDEDSWRLDARHAISDVSSEIEAARLAVQQEQEGNVFAPYLQIVAVEAETNAGKAVEKFSGTQPPSSEISRYSRVSDALDRATGLLGDVRIAVVAGHREQYGGLVRQLARASDRLTEMEAGLAHSPGSAAQR